MKIAMISDDVIAKEVISAVMGDFPGFEVLELKRDEEASIDSIFVTSDANISFGDGRTTRIPQNGKGKKYTPSCARKALGIICVKQGVTPVAMRNAINTVTFNKGLRPKNPPKRV